MEAKQCPECSKTFDDREKFVVHVIDDHKYSIKEMATAWPEPGAWFPTAGHPYRLDDLQPMRDRLLVAPLPVPERTAGGIFMAETSHQREKPQHGIVIKVGPGAYNKQTERLIPMQVQAGDCVFYGKYSGQEFTLDTRRVLNMGENELFSLLPAGTFVLVEHEDAKFNHLQGDYCDLCASPEEKEAKVALAAERERLMAERAAAAGVQELAPAVPVVDVAIEEESAKSALDLERERLQAARRQEV